MVLGQGGWGKEGESKGAKDKNGKSKWYEVNYFVAGCSFSLNVKPSLAQKIEHGANYQNGTVLPQP